MTLKEDLIALADHFDSVGLYVMADEIDKIAVDYSERVLDERSLGYLRKVDEVLNKMYKDPSLNDSLKELIPELAKRLQSEFFEAFSVPKHEFYVPEGEEYEFVPEEVLLATEALANYMDEIQRGKQRLSTTQDPQEQRTIEQEIQEDIRDVEVMRQKLEALKPKYPEAYDLAMRFVQNRDIRLLPERRKMDVPRRRSTDVSPPQRRSTDLPGGVNE